MSKDPAKIEKAKAVGAAIRRARKQRRLVMQAIAAKLGINVAAVGNWEIGKNLPSTDNLIRVADVLNIDPAALGRADVVFLDQDDGNPPGDAEVVTDMAPFPAGPIDVELLGSAVGGDDGDFRFNGEVAGYVRRPPGIMGIKNVFAVHVLSDSMIPRYEPGEVVYCGGRDAVANDHVVIETFPEAEGEYGKAFIKRLKKRTATEIIVEQYNPPKEIRFDRFAIKKMWRVIPWKELLGY